MAAKPRWLWVGDSHVPQNVRDAIGQSAQLVPYDGNTPLAQQLGESVLAVVSPNGQTRNPNWMGGILSELQHNTAMGVFLLPRHAEAARRMLARHEGQFLWADVDAPADELAARFAAAAAVQPIIRKLHGDLSRARRLSAKATRTLEEMDEEMRLAARLQRDFLPRRLPEVGPARFAVLYRPASWVSGDIYDIVRLDETHVGFYVADVVGHGMPAALLTMFIKKALQTKRIIGSSYQIVPPEVSLRELNIDICDQNLPSCQFCTAVYCVLDTQSLMLTYARGGHPEPLVIHADGEVERLWAEGSLLGIFGEEEYDAMQYQLSPGDRLLLYTDGAEEALCRDPSGEKLPLEESVSRWAEFSREEMLLHLTASIDANPPEPNILDDITVVVMDLDD